MKCVECKFAMKSNGPSEIDGFPRVYCKIPKARLPVLIRDDWQESVMVADIEYEGDCHVGEKQEEPR